VLASNAWHPGVIGIAAAKLVERFHRPSVLIAMDGETGRGSVRSIPGVDVCAVLEECAEHLVQFGGHPMAAGLTIERAQVAPFRERFAEAVAKRLDETNSQPLLRIDDEIAPETVDLELAEELERLAPFGYGNARPTFLLRGAKPVGSTRVVGRGHLKMTLRGRDGSGIDCIGFDLAERARGGLPGGRLDVVAHVAVNEWSGRRIPQLQLLDFREALA
jgi:single-stranded-DNA-specific exonuclease